ncbi:hypothetical protein [Parvularcula sp. LCG005]|uniref:hypothetical protein n=1 Tax=Parvularcula sp. LCG005 TaxID=3078805 RepID=UPI002942F8F3|nr:hypothetical protein [Parvularcula sp. LCG005]WOI52053.1 hypothetical protein RUI03_07770 [Parvularcula sp. LCG005]
MGDEGGFHLKLKSTIVYDNARLRGGGMPDFVLGEAINYLISAAGAATGFGISWSWKAWNEKRKLGNIIDRSLGRIENTIIKIYGSIADDRHDVSKENRETINAEHNFLIYNLRNFELLYRLSNKDTKAIILAQDLAAVFPKLGKFADRFTIVKSNTNPSKADQSGSDVSKVIGPVPGEGASLKARKAHEGDKNIIQEDRQGKNSYGEICDYAKKIASLGGGDCQSVPEVLEEIRNLLGNLDNSISKKASNKRELVSAHGRALEKLKGCSDKYFVNRVDREKLFLQSDGTGNCEYIKRFN